MSYLRSRNNAAITRIPTNIVFYKHQLWVYNAGIHVGSKDQGRCNIWVEGEVGRGAQEVGSCLINVIKKGMRDGEFSPLERLLRRTKYKY